VRRTRHKSKEKEQNKVVKILPSRKLGLQHAFVNKLGEPMTKKWSEHSWTPMLKGLGIRHRKFYSTRHTFITEAIKAGENPMAVAQYCGTSLTMIQADYCGALELKNRSVFASSASKLLGRLVAGPGFEGGPLSTTKRLQELTSESFEEWQRAKTA
jgi:integrase